MREKKTEGTVRNAQIYPAATSVLAQASPASCRLGESGVEAEDRDTLVLALESNTINIHPRITRRRRQSLLLTVKISSISMS
jgi:hypothetical protein